MPTMFFYSFEIFFSLSSAFDFYSFPQIAALLLLTLIHNSLMKCFCRGHNIFKFNIDQFPALATNCNVSSLLIVSSNGSPETFVGNPKMRKLHRGGLSGSNIQEWTVFYGFRAIILVLRLEVLCACLVDKQHLT